MSDGIAWQDALPRGTVVRGYAIRQVLGQGGFGIVYRARHLELGNVVAIKEYLPAELAVREGMSVRPRSTAYLDLYQDGLRRFRKEGQALVALHSHSSIVSCRDFFRRNNTAYLVMEFEAGKPLSQVLRERESARCPFSEKDLLDLAVPLLEGLDRVHEAEIVHRDIKPANVLLRESTGEPVLIDFGAAKHEAASRTKSMAPRTPGYAAWEQIVADGALGPWTDIYAVGMLLWRIVAGGSPRNAGRSPVPVERRMDALVRGISDPMCSAVELGRGRFDPKLLAAIDECLKLKCDERVQDCSELLGLLQLEGESQYEVAMRIYRQVPGFETRDDDSKSGESTYAKLRASPLLHEVIEWLLFAVEDDHAAAQYELAFLYHHGIGLRYDPTSARDLIHRSAESSYIKAQRTLAFLYSFAFVYSRFEAREYSFHERTISSDIARICADNFMYEVEWFFRDCYRIYPTQGDYDIPDLPKLSVRWICMCGGDIWSFRVYRDLYDPRIERTKKGGLSAPKKLLNDLSADYDPLSILMPPQPIEEAQYEIGRIFDDGDGVSQDFQEAVRWYRLVAEPERDGYYTATDDWDILTYKQREAYKSADSRLRELARINVFGARDYCWRMYNSGRIVPESVEDALNWIQFGAERGNSVAQYHLGWMYWNGKGVSRDDAEAIKWFRQAAQSGNPDAQNSLGVSYATGREQVRDYVKAQAWFLLASKNYPTNWKNYLSPRYDSDRNFVWAIQEREFLNCITTSKAIRGAIEWEDEASRDCFVSAFDQLCAENRGLHQSNVPSSSLTGSFFYDESSNAILSISGNVGDSMRDVFYEGGNISLALPITLYSRNDEGIELLKDLRDAFSMHPSALRYLRAVYNFAVSRLLVLGPRESSDLSLIQPEHWFVSMMSSLAGRNLSHARYTLSICIAKHRPNEAFTQLCLAAEQDHKYSQILLSIVWKISENIDPVSSSVEGRVSGLSLRANWVDARDKFNSGGLDLGSLGGYLVTAIKYFDRKLFQGSESPLGLVIQKSTFALCSWGLWPNRIGITRMLPKDCWQLSPLFHSGNFSDRVLEFLRFYVSAKVEDGMLSIDEGGESSYESSFESYLRISRHIRTHAFRGDPHAQFIIGALSASGDGVAVDYELSVDLFRAAAEKGDANARLALGILYEHGHGVIKDSAVSDYWYCSVGNTHVSKSKGSIDERGDTESGPEFLKSGTVWSSSDFDKSNHMILQHDASQLWEARHWERWFEGTLGWSISGPR